MRKIFAVTLAALCLCACGEQDAGTSIDRKASPEAAFAAGQAALKRKDHGAFIDTLTDSAVRQQMYTSATICLGSLSGAVSRFVNASTGCDDIMRRYGWTGSVADYAKQDITATLSAVTDPRALARELEENHDKHGTPSGFVWDFLEDNRVSNIVVEGDRARGVMTWDGNDPSTVLFERDSTGWRFDPFAGFAEAEGDVDQDAPPEDEEE